MYRLRGHNTRNDQAVGQAAGRSIVWQDIRLAESCGADRQGR